MATGEGGAYGDGGRRGVTHQPVWMWIAFNAFVIAMLAIDLGIFHRKSHAVGMRESAIWSAVWVTLALIFAGIIWNTMGKEKSLEYLTGYVIEKSLSVDNLFVFLMLFTVFAVPPALQHRVLFWGILGALILRAIFILAGTALLAAFHWTMYVFGLFLLFTGVRMLFLRAEETHPERNPVLRLVRRLFPVTPDFVGSRFFVRRDGRTWATPLFIVLVAIETTDLIFAVDSIPAILAVSRDSFIVYTSNVFAILGLRALYFLLGGMMGLFRFLKVGLSTTLCFVGAKMLLADVYKIPILLSLAVILLLIGGSVVASLVIKNPAGKSAEASSPPGGMGS
jgi:tellurite resistance protein TerC